MSIMKRIKEYFTGEWGKPKSALKTSATNTQDEIETEKLVEQLKNVSEPTYILAKAIDDGVVKTYTVPTYNDAYGASYYISLVFPDKKVIKGRAIITRYTSFGGILYLSGFNSEEREYLFVSVKKAIKRKEAEKEAKLQAEIDAKNTAIRNQITESLQTTK
jgi:hypothetical protein